MTEPLASRRRRRPIAAWLVWAVACIVAGGIAFSALAADTPRPTLRAASIAIENDSASGTDRNYTSGFRVGWVFDNARRDPVAAFLADRVLRADADAEVFRGFSVGQSIFTPRDIEVAPPPVDQHPYGAWLHGEYAVLTRHDGVVERLAIQVGLAGDEAGGQTVQNEIHRLLGVERARGWDYAIDNEVGVVVRYNRTYPALVQSHDSAMQWDFAPVIGGSLGNIYTDLGVGAIARVGRDLRDDFGPPRVRPALTGAGDFERRSGFGWYAFAGVEARYVAQNFFLDGSLFRDDETNVEARRVIYDAQLGMALQYNRTQLAVNFVRRSRQFERQVESQKFASVSLAVRF